MILVVVTASRENVSSPADHINSRSKGILTPKKKIAQIFLSEKINVNPRQKFSFLCNFGQKTSSLQT
jgi:hypothetical protein